MAFVDASQDLQERIAALNSVMAIATSVGHALVVYATVSQVGLRKVSALTQMTHASTTAQDMEIAISGSVNVTSHGQERIATFPLDVQTSAVVTGSVKMGHACAALVSMEAIALSPPAQMPATTRELV